MLKSIKILNHLLSQIVFLIFITYVEMGPNNLHIYDGTSNGELIAGDVFFEIIDPEELEYRYRIRPAKDFGAPFNESINIENALLIPVQPRHCCNIPDNVEELEGNVALIERGECSFKTKTIVAEKAGARAVIITDVSKTYEDYYIEMMDDDTIEETNIPAGFLTGRNGFIIKKTLEKLNRNYAIINLPVNLTFTPIHEINQPPWLGW